MVAEIVETVLWRQPVVEFQNKAECELEFEFSWVV